MSSKRKQHNAKYKFTVALEAAKGKQTISELASLFRVHPSQVSKWKRQLLEGGIELFESNREKKKREGEIQEEEFYEQIGRLKMELEWLKKKAAPFS